MEQKHKYSSHKSRILLTDKAKEDRGFPIYHYYHQLNVVAVIYFVYEVVVIVVNKAVRQLVTATKVYEFFFFFFLNVQILGRHVMSRTSLAVHPWW